GLGNGDAQGRPGRVETGDHGGADSRGTCRGPDADQDDM
ncbi:MAG: hypothetical protein AVDCRST_MAG57-2912, partial [uncultured Blastococcus sp.]